MKKIKDLHKYIIGIVIGIVIVGSISVYAVTAVIESSEVTYNNKVSGGRSENVQGSIDELYERSGVMETEWKDPILHGADPEFDKERELIPVEIDGKGTVKYANLKTKWYEYEEKRWANAVILTDDGKKKNYETGDTIAKADIESYFVWIPRYSYRIWDLGQYTNSISALDNSLQASQDDAENALRKISGNARLIDVKFGEVLNDQNESIESYYTNTAFTTFGVKGFWVGKFEVTGSNNAITVKPNNIPLTNQTLGNFWQTLYNYKRNLDSHMIKNTEWGAVAYLSHSIYGIGTEVNTNNTGTTGYSAAANIDQSSCPSEGATIEEKDKTQPWNTSTGYLASTTGNITGVYDMSGGVEEYVAAYIENQLGLSGLTNNDIAKSNYFDKYSTSTGVTFYNNRILGDATGEMGPFYQYFDKDGGYRYHNSWYADNSNFITSYAPFLRRGGVGVNGKIAGQFNFVASTGVAEAYIGTRLVLAVK